MRTTRIENTALQVDVLPDFGARVVRLVDKVSGRDWMASGGVSDNVAEGAVYSVAEAIGWDECFPTVSTGDGETPGWGRRLRDHGDVWGRPWHVDRETPTCLATTYLGREFEFSRSLELLGATLTAHYTVRNTGSSDLPYLWAMHGLLAIGTEDRIVMRGVKRVAGAYLTLGGRQFAATVLDWPGPSATYPVALDQIQPASSAIAAKLYATALPSRSVAVGRAGQWLDIAWDDSIDDLGIWATYGGWPAPGGTHQLALEPTTASADGVDDAIARGAAIWLKPRDVREWTIRLSVSSGAQAERM